MRVHRSKIKPQFSNHADVPFHNLLSNSVVNVSTCLKLSAFDFLFATIPPIGFIGLGVVGSEGGRRICPSLLSSLS
jgi:hypothetical protein